MYSSFDVFKSNMSSNPPKYKLRVAAGPSYDPDTHQDVLVNSEKNLSIENEHGTINLCVRIQDYTGTSIIPHIGKPISKQAFAEGLPSGSPRTSDYFSHPNHTNDQYSIAFSFVPKRDIPGADLVFGNDFDHSVRDRLPPGTNYALKLVRWMVDPGIEGDLYSDKPYLYGAALSSWNYFRICGRHDEAPTRRSSSDSAVESAEGSKSSGEVSRDFSDDCDLATALHREIVEEGAEGSGEEIRAAHEIPGEPDLRKKHFLDEAKRQAFNFEAGRIYKVDFGNPYLGFSG